MKIQYFPEDDVIYIELSDKGSAESEEVLSGIVIDFDENGVPVGIEISNASNFMHLDKFAIFDLPIRSLVVENHQ